MPGNRSWYPFQLAFILLNLPGITKLDHPDRSEGPEAMADLLWFPTGGGKTEAYLGLSAYTMGLRRLQGTVAGRSGEIGRGGADALHAATADIQQFQRATALICACESIRRKARTRRKWGKSRSASACGWARRRRRTRTDEPRSDPAGARASTTGGGGSGSPAQLTNCPWCGAKIDAGPGHQGCESYAKGRCRTLTYCGDMFGRCPFTPSNRREGIPVLVVDEEIYRRLPTLLIATVDKFAQMPWNGKVQMLFGQVESHCDRHGFRSPEIEDADSTRRRDRLPAAKTTPHPPTCDRPT